MAEQETGAIRRAFTEDDIHMGIQLRGVYDGICVYVLKDGTAVNRFQDHPDHYAYAASQEATDRHNAGESAL